MSIRAHRWVVAGGGTGGHVTPALALAERIRSRGDSVLLLGSSHGLESRLVPEAGFELRMLPSAQLMGKGVLARLTGIGAIARGVFAARRTLQQEGTEIVVSVGGYASVPAALAAATLRLPLAIVEPNAEPGRANRLVARLARRLFVHFDRAAARLAPAGDARVEITGIPLRTALVEAFESAPARRAPQPPLSLLIFGGSQGARQINDAMLELAPRLAEARLRIVHQTGDADRDRVAQGYREAGVEAEVLAFAPDMPRRYREADLAICRSGALTVAELAMAGLPSLLVPYPHAADDHQRANAEALEAAGAARVLPSRPLASESLAQALFELVAAPATLQTMSEAAARLARPAAADAIITSCCALFED